ncbi:hypothetical protein L2X98_31925 [Microbacterium elymi]|uniref:Uncharacterized protein n=1 Tax=Microbacterium elymi TaxID=2909587 RepID=A0ABY5NIJ3_9MICO|nr:hypothetical protein [Microbacterium elymi]UUT34973.1 hypothetical protein L2X98_31925 [Microbacterium elymi]
MSVIPDHTSEVIAELDVISQVCSPLCVPVLPNSGVPSFGFATAAVPPGRRHPCRAYSAVAAMPGSIAWVQVRSGTGRSLPSASVTRAMTRGWQNFPWLAMAAYAPAIAIGETELDPSTEKRSVICTGPWPLASVTPSFVASFITVHRSSLAAIAR